MATPHPRTSSDAATGAVSTPEPAGSLVTLLDVSVDLDEDRLATHRRWSAGLTGAVFGPVDPFDLVVVLADRFPALRGTIDDGLFIVDWETSALSAVMVSADRGSAAMFTAPTGSIDRVRFAELFDAVTPFDQTAPAVQVELVDQAVATNEDLIAIVTSGVIGSALVFDELVRPVAKRPTTRSGPRPGSTGR